MASIFSKIVSGDIPAYKVAENEKFLAFLDIRPLKKGHTLVIPKKEIDYIFDLDDDLIAEMNVFAKKVARAIQKSVPCLRIAVVVLGLEVPHAHIHLIPIDSEKDTNFSNQRVELSKEEFEEVATRISSSLD